MARFGTTVLAKARKGAGLAEYGILGGLVSVLAVSSVLALGEEVQGTFTTVSEAVSSQGESSDNGQAPAPVGPQYGLYWAHSYEVQFFDETNSSNGGYEVYLVYPITQEPVWIWFGPYNSASQSSDPRVADVAYEIVDTNENGLIDRDEWAIPAATTPEDAMSSLGMDVMTGGNPMSGVMVVVSPDPLPAMIGQDPFVALGLTIGEWEPLSPSSLNPAP
jgi:Flp pilus assembly pilin Flp